MIQIEHLSKSFKTADGTVEALKDITLTVPDGEIFGIIGMSGAGKSTLVRCINMLERPTEGRVIIDGCDISALPAKQLREMRRSITMIFQGFNLLMQRNCLKNVCFPMELAGIPAREAEARAKELLELVGLGDKLKAYPAQLSGGQQQRVAIARALATHPRILLCDEATSALDPQSTQSILALIRDIHDKLGLTVIVITHQMSVVEQICTQVAILDNGAVAEVGPVSEVFASPSSQAAKRLVYPEGYDQPIASPGEHLIRIVFNGADSAKTPLIAHMAMHENIAASIVSASTRSIGGKTYGNMLLGIPGGAEELRRAMDYLGGTPDIIVEEVKPDEH
ncbi:MAG: ATP-binding cassette domain-containing protein [Oscillospiraceae bacterium]|nr:MAG: ATP-binding cassette domain-containing protein [Oscillospiraceae bacterium]